MMESRIVQRGKLIQKIRLKRVYLFLPFLGFFVLVLLSCSTLENFGDLTLPPSQTTPEVVTSSPSPIATITSIPTNLQNQVLTASPEFKETNTPLITPIVISPTATQPVLEPSTPIPTPIFNQTPAPDITLTSYPTFVSFSQDSWCIPWTTERQTAFVTRVLDGVTIEATLDQQTLIVRYIGIDIPEDPAKPGLPMDAFEMNQELVEGKEVLLIRDRSDIDSANQLPRYVLVDGIFVNLALVQSGYAVAESAPPDVNCDALFQSAEELAISTGVGVWAPLPTPTRTFPPPTETTAALGLIKIINIRYKGASWQDPNEFVEIRNDETYPIKMQGWTLRDNDNHVYTFPDFVMNPGNYCRIYTNEYHPASCGFSYFSRSPIWDNEQDCAFLKDAQGNLVDQFCYGY